MANTYTYLLYHIIFSTKYRKKDIHGALKDIIYEFISNKMQEKSSSIISIGGISDHIHILALLPSKLSISDIVKEIKAGSSHYINSNNIVCDHFEWQRGYAAFSVSKSVQDKIIAYIENQEKHHEKMDFKDELVNLLQKHGVAFDEKFLLD
jgi:REP element-mobilizing transposase RayT